MRTLYHLWLCPFARKVRMVLAEKKLPFELELEKVWERRDEFLALNPTGEVPVLIEAGEDDEPPRVFADSVSICEYLEDTAPEPALLGGTASERAETITVTVRA